MCLCCDCCPSSAVCTVYSSDVNKDWTHKDKDKDHTLKDQDKDKD